VPYNGGVSKEQLGWLKQVLAQSVTDEEKVVIFCHQPIYAPNKPQSVVWNAEELLELVHQSGNVLCWIAGHDHGGQYSMDEEGVHHLVPPAPIECELGTDSFACISVFQDRLHLDWRGEIPTTMLPFPGIMKVNMPSQ
jgi:manganese-dependent ADP-ribose/CDP-alcohol diphosphatase